MTDIKIKILGSGTSAITKERNPAGILVEAGGVKILLDAGYGTLRRLVEYGINYQNIEVAGVSHFHADHFVDIFPLVFARFVDNSYKGIIESKELKIMGPKDLETRYQKWREIYWPNWSEQYPVKFLEGENELEVGEVAIKSIKVKHVDYFESVAFKVEFKNKSVVYTGDFGSTNKMDELVEKFRGVDLLITEASYEQATANHFTFEQISELKDKGQIKKVVIAHISSEQIERIKKRCLVEEDINMAEDGMEIEI